MLGSSEQPGVIPRAVREILSLVNARDEAKGWEYSIGMSYLEIYNEKVGTVVWMVSVSLLFLRGCKTDKYAAFSCSQQIEKHPVSQKNSLLVP